MKKLFKSLWVYNTPDRTGKNIKRIHFTEDEYKQLDNYIDVCDFLLEHVKVTLSADNNYLLKFNKNDFVEPPLVDYSIHLDQAFLKVDPELWKKIRNAKKDYFKENNREDEYGNY